MTAAGAVPAVEALRVVGLRAPHGPRQSCGFPRHGQQMGMIRHEAPAQDLQIFRGGASGEQIQVLGAILFREEDGLAIVPPRGNVKRNTRFDEPCLACHVCLVQDRSVGSQTKSPSVPIYSTFTPTIYSPFTPFTPIYSFCFPNPLA